MTIENYAKPIHPAARAVSDAEGKPVILGIAEAELRMSCVHAVTKDGLKDKTVDAVITDAERLFQYVMGQRAA